MLNLKPKHAKLEALIRAKGLLRAKHAKLEALIRAKGLLRAQTC